MNECPVCGNFCDFRADTCPVCGYVFYEEPEEDEDEE